MSNIFFYYFPSAVHVLRLNHEWLICSFSSVMRQRVTTVTWLITPLWYHYTLSQGMTSLPQLLNTDNYDTNFASSSSPLLVFSIKCLIYFLASVVSWWLMLLQRQTHNCSNFTLVVRNAKWDTYLVNCECCSCIAVRQL